MKKHTPLLLGIGTLLVTLSGTINANEQPAPVSSLATKLAQESIIMDGHIDVPYRIHDKWVDVSQSTEDGQFDYPRAKQGGLNGPFMSIYIPADLDNSKESTLRAHQLIDYMEALVGRAPDRFAIAKSPADIQAHFDKGLISLPMGLENGSPIQGDLANLKHFYERGIRYITLTHSRANHISDSSYDIRRKWGGLSDFGKELVVEMNRLGVMVDISHVSDKAFYDAIKISKAPMIASHSSMRKFTPGFERNMSDDMVKALAEKGGVIMINFGSTFLTREARLWSDTRTELRKPIENKYGRNSQQYKDFTKQYRAENPLPFAQLKHAVQHIDYAVKLVGVDHVGLGSDFDGVGDSLPTGLKDVSYYPNLVQALLDLDYSETDIKKILGGNTLRVWRAVEQVANAD